MTEETAAAEPKTEGASTAALRAVASRTTLSIAAAVGVSSMAFAFWQPFLPLYLLELGAKTETEAILWVGIATTVQGITRLVGGPIWGLLSDRYGRKMMFLRALFFGSITTAVMVFVTEPWQVAIAFGCQGLFSGFVPASVALISVSVPDERLNSSLSTVTGAQYLGNTIGPAVGAIFAIVFGYEGAIILASAMPAIMGTAVLLFVPKDHVAVRAKSGTKEAEKLEAFKPSFQFWLAVFTFFIVFTVNQILRLVTPIAVRQLDEANVEGITGLTFTLGGLTSAVAVLFLAPRAFRGRSIIRSLVISAVLTGGAQMLLGASSTVAMYVFGFALISLLQAAMIPASNTLIAGNVSRARRGTAFGIASSAQALSFIVGPIFGTVFTALSLNLGFVVLGGVFMGLAVLLAVAMKEPPKEPSVEQTA